MEGRVIIHRYGLEARIGQHALDDPGKSRIFVAHMGDDAFVVEFVVLDGELGPALDIAIQSVGHADKDDVAEIKIGAGLQRIEDARQRHRLPEIGQMMQCEFADDQVVGIGLISEAQQARELRADLDLAVARQDVGEREHGG